MHEGSIEHVASYLIGCHGSSDESLHSYWPMGFSGVMWWLMICGEIPLYRSMDVMLWACERMMVQWYSDIWNGTPLVKNTTKISEEVYWFQCLGIIAPSVYRILRSLHRHFCTTVPHHIVNLNYLIHSEILAHLQISPELMPKIKVQSSWLKSTTVHVVEYRNGKKDIYHPAMV